MYVSLIVFYGPLLLFVDGTFFFFAPSLHLVVAVTTGGFFGKQWLSGFFHGENVVENDDFVEFVSWETELIFNFDESFGFKVIIELITSFSGLLFGELEAFNEIVDNFMEFNTIDRRLLLEYSGHMMWVDSVCLRDAKMFGDEDRDFAQSGLVGLHGNYLLLQPYIIWEGNLWLFLIDI